MCQWLKNILGENPELNKIRDLTEFVHKNCVYKADPGWQLNFLMPGQVGDCDSFAATVAKILEANGVPMSRMAVVAYKFWDGQDHAVLQIQSEDGHTIWYADAVYNTVSREIDGPALVTAPEPLWELLRNRSKSKILG